MSKVKELYMEMSNDSMDYALRGLNVDEIYNILIEKYKQYGSLWGAIIAEEACKDVQSYHDDMMHAAYSYEQEV